jgi:hypothetical protein
MGNLEPHVAFPHGSPETAIAVTEEVPDISSRREEVKIA